MNRLPVTPLLLLLVTLTGCSRSNDDDDSGSSGSIQTFTTNWGADQSTTFAFLGDNFAYLAAETHSDNFDANGDGDHSDAFPVVVDTVSKVETQLGVATRGLVWVGDHLYLDVLESDDDFDWDGSTAILERVLLHWNDGMAAPEFVTTLDLSAEIALVSTGELAIADTSATTTITDTPLVLLEADNPTTPVSVPNDEGLAIGTTVEIIALLDGLLFVGIDETSSGTDYNGDLDSTDTRVLGLLDATHELGLVAFPDSLYSMGLALPTGDTPLLAESVGSHDWLVGFLVDEASQDENLNSSALPSFSPCLTSDSDKLDEVMHFMRFLDVVQDGNSVTNSRLVGSERIIHADGYVGTISREGDEATCDLNGDGDTDDRVFRWVLADPGNPTYENSLSRLHALTDISGPANEVAEMGDRFVIVVNEITDGDNHDGLNENGTYYDWDGDGDYLDDRDLIAWLEPTADTEWTFHHDNDIDFGWVVATWMGEAVGTNRVGIGFSEQSNDSPFDITGDGDKADSVPTFAYFDSGSGFMEFPGFAIAVDPDNAGIVILGNRAYYRVSELENGGDLNDNGSVTDNLLWASHLSTGKTFDVSPLNSLPETDSILADPLNASCAAFLVKEGGAIGDLNGDGDMSGFAVRYLRF